jgi:hypothetical protein
MRRKHSQRIDASQQIGFSTRPQRYSQWRERQ